jgi:Nucleotidyl transferase AbiEii toxin, Type IV TA system
VASPVVNPLEGALRRIARDLQQAGKSWALIGGLAVGARAEPRTTRDVDLIVAIADDKEAEALVFWLQTLGYGVLIVLEQTAAGRLSTVRFRPPNEPEGGVIVDLLFASSGIETEIIRAAEGLEIIPGLIVPVARIGHLLALKALARNDRDRPQDLDDPRALLLEAEPQDLEDARVALQLIEERGYHRGRRLREEFERLAGLSPE